MSPKTTNRWSITVILPSCVELRPKIQNPCWNKVRKKPTLYGEMAMKKKLMEKRPKFGPGTNWRKMNKRESEFMESQNLCSEKLSSVRVFWRIGGL